jgi:beta-carotene hydroxylase
VTEPVVIGMRADQSAPQQAKAGAVGRKAGREALALDATDMARLEALCQPNAGVFLRTLAAHLGLWALGLVVVAQTQAWPWLQAVVGLLMGSQLHALTVLQHDCGHQSAFRSRAANLWVGRVLAWFILLPFTSFTELHRRHHSHLGETDLDPDNWFYAGGPRWTHLRECLFMPRFIWLSATGTLAPAIRRRVRLELAANGLLHGLLVAALLLAGRPDVWLFAFGLPMLALACIFNPLARGAEHAPMSHLTQLPQGDPRREDLRFNTVTIAHRGWGLVWANITYHVEHHLHPRVPFHKLPALHALMQAQMRRAGEPLTSAAYPPRTYLSTRSLFPFLRPPG